jgi:glycogen debranching enzyme
MTVPENICRDFARSSKIEWLETNGTGAFAMGTAAGVNTRRYHALLIASLRPPVERYAMLSRIEEEIEGAGLGVAQYPGVVTPRGYEFLESFQTDPCATWIFRAGGVRLEKQVYMIENRQAVVVRYRADRAAALRLRPFLAYRDYHSLGHARADVYGSLPPIRFTHGGRFNAAPEWYYNHEYLEELDRGLDFREDLFTPGVIALDLKANEWAAVCASIEDAEYGEPRARANPFLVRRADGSPTIIAGYPWFTDWGRDTMISLPGLLRDDAETARGIIDGFCAHMRDGVIPNRFPDRGEQPEYNTADATLWMVHAAESFGMRERFRPVAERIIEAYRRRADPADGLVQNAAQETWMDTKYTPREGKCVEINALWHAALRIAGLDDEADRVRESFREKFWNAGRNYLRDRVGDERLRPNQIFAVSLGWDVLGKSQQQAVVCAVHRELLTPFGLRTLARGDPDYKPRYAGGAEERDAAYHQGTVWPWLLGPFIDAYLIAFGRNERNLEYCRGLVARFDEMIPEIYDGDDPHLARGCPAQAWSVAEIARGRRVAADRAPTS